MDIKPASQILEDAAEHVRKGWCQGKLQGSHGEVCALGATLLATPVSLTMSRASVQNELRNEANEMLGQIVGNYDVAWWNDEHDRTATEVADAMITAAKTLRNQGR